MSSAVLIIPYIGFEYIRQTETYLRSTLEKSLTDISYVVASSLNNKPRLFRTSFTEEKNAIYIHELNSIIQIDGYINDWKSYLDWSELYQSASLEDKDNFKLIISKDNNYYYILFQVKDNELIFSSRLRNNKIDGDHFILVYRDGFLRLHKNYLSPIAPGSIRPFYYQEITNEYGIRTKTKRILTNISSYLQRTENGFDLEVRIPKYFIGDNLGFVFNDIDYQGNVLKSNYISTYGIEPNKIISSSKEIEDIISNHSRNTGRRIWILDKFGQVLATSGSLKQKFEKNVFNIFYTYLLPPAYDQFQDDLAGASRLKGSEVMNALSGDTATKWRSSPDKKAVIVSAATPISFNNEVVGAVVVEETTNNIQLMQRQVLSDIFNRTLLMLVCIVFVLLLFAGRLSSRLIKLNRDATGAIDEYGKVQGKFIASHSSDEIGELSRSFNDILERLEQYHIYLEGMAGRLSHELATPMAIVKSSLDRLKQEGNEYDKKEALNAAETGLERLQNLLTRLSEAARVEQALQESEKRTTDLNKFLEQCVDGYRFAYSSQLFELNTPNKHISLEINPDLFYQMLDKLVGNAVDFSYPEKKIYIKLFSEENKITLQVINYGPQLSKNMTDELFNSMVSVRDKRTDASPHLGLGLFIAKLIAEFHGGIISAANLTEDEGVCFSITI
ncbi:MAG: ATP-binding protein [Pseudomonadota bacterium]|nr:ATP-binding protein [Pseudomonadota bacterium]